MTIKTLIPVYTGPVAVGLSRHVVPPLQGYGRGVLLVRFKNKATDGGVGCALAEFTEAGADEAWKVDEIVVGVGETEWEWRLETSLPAIHYEVQTFMDASAADVDITLIAS